MHHQTRVDDGTLILKSVKPHKVYIGLTFTFIILWLIASIRDIGTDLEVYRSIYTDSNTNWAESYGIEPGYLLLNKVINALGFSEFVGLGIINLLSYGFIYATIRLYKNKIDIGISCLAFCCLYYFQSFDLVRIYLTAAFLLYTSKFLLKKEYLKYAACNAFAILFHYSSIAMFMPLGLLWIYNRNKRVFYICFILVTILMFKAASILSTIPIFERYQNYTSGGSMDNSIGLMQYLINFPILALTIYCHKLHIKSNIINIMWVYCLSSLLIGLLSYKILMLGRVLIYFNIIYLICIPYALRQIKYKSSVVYPYIYYGFVVYYFIRFYQYLSGYLVLDGIMPYKTIL